MPPNVYDVTAALVIVTCFGVVHVAPPSVDSSTHNVEVPPLLLSAASAWTVIPLIDATLPGSPNA